MLQAKYRLMRRTEDTKGHPLYSMLLALLVLQLLWDQTCFKRNPLIKQDNTEILTL